MVLRLDRAAQLIGEATEEEAEGELVAEDQVTLSREQRVAGCVLGTAVGDALGAPWMFADLSTILRENPEGVRTMAEVFGKRAAATAHGQQTVFVLDGLIRSRIRSVLRGVSAHRPSMVRGSLLHWLTDGDGLAVNSFHHQAADRIGAGLEVAARAPDGTVEALWDPAARFSLGVQWHAELLTHRAEQASLLSGLVHAACGMAPQLALVA